MQHEKLKGIGDITGLPFFDIRSP